MLKNQWLLWLNLMLTAVMLASFVAPLTLETTTAGIVVGTLFTTVGAVLIAAVPAYLMGGVLSGILKAPGWMRQLVFLSAYVLAGMPSIIIGIIGFLVFCNLLGFGWSMLSAMLTLLLLLYPTMVTAFTQMLTPLGNRYTLLARSTGVGPVEFQFRMVPKLFPKEITEVLVLGWATSLGDTAAVMLTCGALTEFPQSVMDSVRLLNYHIYLLAMEIPGGMVEARTLSLLLILFLLILLALPRIAISHRKAARELRWKEV